VHAILIVGIAQRELCERGTWVRKVTIQMGDTWRRVQFAEGVESNV
jgi:hypothetical protein